jgi:hypothetical protein
VVKAVEEGLHVTKTRSLGRDGLLISDGTSCCLAARLALTVLTFSSSRTLTMHNFVVGPALFSVNRLSSPTLLPFGLGSSSKDPDQDESNAEVVSCAILRFLSYFLVVAEMKRASCHPLCDGHVTVPMICGVWTMVGR